MSVDEGSSIVMVWDPLVRIVHWTVALGFVIAYLVEDDLMSLHVWAGYTIGVLELVRIVWGFIGTRHASARRKDAMHGSWNSPVVTMA